MEDIRTYYDPPPIPGWKEFAWSAVSDGYEAGDPIGYGPTKQDAIQDLKDQLEEADDVWRKA